MSFKLIRGMKLEEIVEVFRKREKGEDVSEKLGSNDCSLSLGANILKSSTVKSSLFEFSSTKFYENYGEELYLVVFNESKWVDDTYGKEPYSVVVTIEYIGDELEVGLYTKINQHIQARLNIKQREKVRTTIKVRS